MSFKLLYSDLKMTYLNTFVEEISEYVDGIGPFYKSTSRQIA